MTFHLALVAWPLLALSLGPVQEPPPGSPLDSLVEAERAFSRMSVDQGVWPAFLAFFADDGIGFKSEPINMMDIERTLSNAAAQVGTAKAYLACGSRNIRMYRDGLAPIIGVPAAQSYLSAKPVEMSWEPLQAEVSRSNDLGYAYGRYTARSAAAGQAAVERGYYVRVWERQSDGWRIVFDVTSPVPTGTPTP